MNIQKISYAIFITVVAVIAAAIVIPALPIKGNYKIMAVLSGSMEPKIKTGGIVMVKPAADYKVGDVISFVTANNRAVSTTHRIVAVKTEDSNTIFTTKGDANNAEDANQVDKRNVIGKVFVTIPYAGYLLAFVHQPMGFVAAVIIPSSLVIYDEAKNIWREFSRRGSRYDIVAKVKVRVKQRTARGFRIKVKEIS
jgi:signal peptidase